MKAILCTQYGPPEVLQAGEVPKPAPRDDEVLIRVRATTVSVADTRCRAFRVPASFWIPARIALGLFKPKRRILGGELSGEVAEIGKAVTRFKVGDRVFAESLMRPGGYAEYTCLPQSGPLALMPTTLSYEEAAAVPIGAAAALHFLRRAKVASGHRVLIYGASGSVGTFAVQLAKYYGAKVTAVCSAANLELVRSLGADAALDYAIEDFTRQGHGYDLVLVAVDEVPFARCLQALEANGTYANVTLPLKSLAMHWAALTRHVTIITGARPVTTAEDLTFLKGLLEEGRLRSVIDRRYPLEQIVEAHRYVDQGHKKGGVVISVA
jgi:NADPH:quinone reductase-like Zn-dependent oxidoreductase